MSHQMTFRTTGDSLEAWNIKAMLNPTIQDILLKALGAAVMAGLTGEGEPPEDCKSLLAQIGVEITEVGRTSVH